MKIGSNVCATAGTPINPVPNMGMVNEEPSDGTALQVGYSRARLGTTLWIIGDQTPLLAFCNIKSPGQVDLLHCPHPAR